MSLQLLAKQMEAKGRKGDSMLVHMTPGEVEGLQKLAESAGGTLTVNPETGLVEANFLKRMLPTLVGIGVGIGTGNPFLGAAAGAAVGGYQAKENDQDVLVGAGLGALGGYGGAGLGAGLTAAGGTAAAGAAGQQAATLSAEELAKKQAAEELAKQAAADEATRQATEQAGKNLAEEQAKQQLLSSTGVTPPSMTMSGTQPDLAAQYGMTDVNMTPMPANVQPMPVQPELTAAERFSQAGRGIGQMGTEEGQAAFAKKFGMQQAMAGAAPAMAPGKLEKEEGVPVDDEMYYTEYTPGQTGERSSTSTEAQQFAGTYSPMERIKASEYTDRVRRRNIYAAKGGLMSFAEGGVAGNSGPTTEAMDYLMGDAGASQAGLQYLMGDAGASQAGLQYLMGQADRSAPQITAAPRMATATAAPEFLAARSDREYIFNPASGQFIKNQAYNTGMQDVFVDASGKDYYQAQGRNEIAPMDPKTVSFLENETPAERDARIAGVGRFVGNVATALIPGAGLVRLAADAFMPKAAEPAAATAGSTKKAKESNRNTSYGETVNSPGLSRGSYSDGSGNAAGAGSASAAQGGLISLAKGGMKSGGFVIPADVVSMIGEGNTDAGYSRIKSMVPGATAIKGKDGGQADTVKTSIEGKQPARVAHGEMYVPPETVKRMGGAKKLYAMMDRVRHQATGSKKQIKPVSLKKALA